MSGTLLSTRNRSFSTASIRKRMIRSGSQHQSQRQLIKNSTQTSFRPKLERLIQQGKIQQILNSDKHSKANLAYSSHLNDMQKQLNNSKKNLSNMVLKARSKELNINKLKNEIKRYQNERQKIKQNNERINKIYEETLSTLDNKKQAKDIAQWNEKSYLYIKDRLTKDQYYHKIQYQLQQKIYQEEALRSKFLQKKSHELMNQNKELQNAMNSAKQISGQQTYHKNEVIDLINQQRLEKQFLHDLRLDKQSKQNQINELSSWVIEKEQLTKYLQIYYTHKILDQIVKTKNNNLMKKYQQVQKAYMHIKSNTNIIEFDKIIKKMEEQDSIYDITIRRVSDLQTHLQKMQKALVNARNQRNKILSREGQNNQIQKDYYKGIQKDKYELLLSEKEKREFRVVQDQILKQRITDWTDKICKKMNLYRNQNTTLEEALQKCVDRLKPQIKPQKKRENEQNQVQASLDKNKTNLITKENVQNLSLQNKGQIKIQNKTIQSNTRQ